MDRASQVLCDTCEGIHFDSFIEKCQSEASSLQVKSLGNIQISAKTCNTCRVILYGATRFKQFIRKKSGRRKVVFTDDDMVFIYTARPPWPNDEREPQCVGIKVFTKTRGADWEILPAFIALYTEDNDALRYQVPLRIPELDSSSEKALRRVETWLEKCEKNHNCVTSGNLSDKTGVPPLPSRVIDVGYTTRLLQVRVIDSHGGAGQYMALSHCWGISPRLVLKSTTKKRFQEGVPIADLAKTFQDAIFIAQRLKIPYLWIDCLCILQDDIEDWQIESARMASIYMNAYLSIAAGGTNDDSSGCFPLRPSLHFSPAARRYLGVGKVNTPTIDSDLLQEVRDTRLNADIDARISVCIIPMNGRTIIGTLDPLDDDPISQRGWTLQERSLARRIIHFGKEQMYWECCEGTFAEDGTVFRPRPLCLERICTGKPSEAEYMLMLYRKRHMSGFDMDGWLQLAEMYSHRKFSHVADKLPALSGIASAYFELMKISEKYCARIWRQNLLEGLEWHVRPGGVTSRGPLSLRRRIRGLPL